MLKIGVPFFAPTIHLNYGGSRKMRSKPKVRNMRFYWNAGFSLPETIIALLILSIAILAIVFVPIMSSKMALQTTHRERAMSLAVNALNFLEAQSFNVSIDSEDIIGDFTVKTEKPVFNQAQYQNYKAKATVTWKGVSGASSLVMERSISKFSSTTRKE